MSSGKVHPSMSSSFRVRTQRVLQLAALFSAVVFVPTATADAPLVDLERMTWIEVRDRIATGTKTIIIPTGGTEQNGRHMVLGKHNIIVGETARRIARQLGDALVAPVMAYVPEGDAEKKTGHMAFAGTVTVSEQVYEGLLTETAKSFKAHGFTTIVLLGDSGGNQVPQDNVANRLSDAWSGDAVRVINAGNYYGRNGGDAYLLSQGETVPNIGSHAGIRDTSELLAVDPSAVRLANVARDVDGATGDASRATAAYGEKLLRLKVAAAVLEIQTERARPFENSWRLWVRMFGAEAKPSTP